MDESDFKAKISQEIQERYPEAIILRIDPTFVQGFPDILILYGRCWAALEAKRSKKASIRPNQPYYVDLTDQMSFGAFIFPENKEDVFARLFRFLDTNGGSRH